MLWNVTYDRKDGTSATYLLVGVPLAEAEATRLRFIDRYVGKPHPARAGFYDVSNPRVTPWNVRPEDKPKENIFAAVGNYSRAIAVGKECAFEGFREMGPDDFQEAEAFLLGMMIESGRLLKELREHGSVSVVIQRDGFVRG